MNRSSREVDSQWPEVTVTRLPVRDDHIARLVLVALLCIFIALGVSEAVPLWQVLAIALLCMAACWKLILPMRIELGPRGIMRATLFGAKRIPWREVARYESHPTGVVIFLSDESSPLAGIDSIDISGTSKQNELESVVKYYMESQQFRAGSSIVSQGSSKAPSTGVKHL